MNPVVVIVVVAVFIVGAFVVSRLLKKQREAQRPDSARGRARRVRPPSRARRGGGKVGTTRAGRGHPAIPAALLRRPEGTYSSPAGAYAITQLMLFSAMR